MSAYIHVYQGQHDYNRHSFVPIRMEAMVHKKLHKKLTFAQHCKKGYVLGTSFEHYPCQTIWMTDLHTQCTTGAVWFKHKYLTNPSVYANHKTFLHRKSLMTARHHHRGYHRILLTNPFNLQGWATTSPHLQGCQHSSILLHYLQGCQH